MCRFRGTSGGVRRVPELAFSCRVSARVGACQPMEAGLSIEAVIGVILVRVVLALAGIVIGVIALVLISRESRRRMELPADLIARVKALDHQVAELDETFGKHLRKDSARASRASRSEAANLPAEPLAPGVAPSSDNRVPMDVWRGMSRAQRANMEAAGLAPTGGNGGM